MNPITLSSNPLSPSYDFVTWTAEPESCVCTIWWGHVSNDGHTHAQLISLPLSLCSMRSTGLLVQLQHTVIKFIMNFRLAPQGEGGIRINRACRDGQVVLGSCMLLGKSCLCSQFEKPAWPVFSVCQSGIFKLFLQQVQLKIQWELFWVIAQVIIKTSLRPLSWPERLLSE